MKEMRKDESALAEKIRRDLLENIKKTMEQEDISQGEVARRIDGDRPNVNKIMCGRMKVSTDHLLMIAEVIGLDVELKTKLKK
jgi:predicted XRE-type DNA-binding protein